MADMYGAIRSNDFKVKDVTVFLEWFTGYLFGTQLKYGLTGRHA